LVENTRFFNHQAHEAHQAGSQTSRPSNRAVAARSPSPSGRGIKGEGERVTSPDVTESVWIFQPFSLSPALSPKEREPDFSAVPSLVSSCLRGSSPFPFPVPTINYKPITTP
jgi:hypothetical protein